MTSYTKLQSVFHLFSLPTCCFDHRLNHQNSKDTHEPGYNKDDSAAPFSTQSILRNLNLRLVQIVPHGQKLINVLCATCYKSQS
jgi:hypothetical protein